MNLFKTKLSDLKPVDLEEIESYEFDEQFIELKKLLTRIGKSEQKTAQIVELLKDEVGKNLSDSRNTLDEVRKEKTKLSMENKEYKESIIEYCDIIDALEANAEEIHDKAFEEAAKIAVAKKDEICKKIGIQEVPGEGSKTDSDIHYVRDKEITDNEELVGTIKKVIRKGYRLGSEVLRQADVIVYTKK